MHRDVRQAFKKRAEQGYIVGRSDSVKGFKVYLPKDRVVIVTQHVKNVETLTPEQNEQLLARWMAGDQVPVHREEEGNHSSKDEAPAPRTRPDTTPSAGMNTRNRATRRPPVVNVALDPRSYREAMRGPDQAQ